MSKLGKQFVHLWQYKSIKTATVLSALLILFQFFQWDLMELITPFLMVPLQGLLYLVFFVALVISVVGAIRHRKNKESPQVASAGIYFIAALLAVFVPWTNIWLVVNFATHLSVRSEVVRQIENGTLKNNVSYNTIRIDLPANLKGASMGGYVLVEPDSPGKRRILFFTFAGILDNYSGYVYSETGLPPLDFLNDRVDASKVTENWYFISSY